MIVSGLAVAPRCARADTTPDAPLDHHHQVGLAVLPGMGFRIIVPYKENKTCGDTQSDAKRVCTNAVPFFLELQASFGVSRRIDLLTDVRFGLGTDFTNHHQFTLAPGFRIWLDQEGAVKLFTTLQALYDHTAEHQDGIADDDYGLRNANGLMYDPLRNLGIYLQFGETVGLVRWFRIDVDLGIGVQVRFP